jgi:putative endonuclease
MHFLYIIYSKSSDKFYVGETYNIKERILQHNTHQYKYAFSKIAQDWEIKLIKELRSKEDAIFLERFIKRMKSKKFILKVIDNSDILDDILKKR